MTTEAKPREPVTCVRCGLTWVPGGSEEAAMEEALSLWGTASFEGPQDILCDDCFASFMAWAGPRGLVVGTEPTSADLRATLAGSEVLSEHVVDVQPGLDAIAAYAALLQAEIEADQEASLQDTRGPEEAVWVNRDAIVAGLRAEAEAYDQIERATGRLADQSAAGVMDRAAQLVEEGLGAVPNLAPERHGD